jgi:hypothetical protein
MQRSTDASLMQRPKPPQPSRFQGGMRATGPALVVLGAAACTGAGAASPTPTAYVVDLPPPGAEPATTAAPRAEAACPPGSSRETHGAECVRLVPSPEIPAWKPPTGHLDPCATWTSDRGLINCDPANEEPADAGRP